MEHQTPERYSRGVVILGDFNPKIFHPAWLAAENLIGKQEAEQAKIEVVHPDVSIFSIEWLRIEVLRERFVAETTQQSFDKPLRDIVLGIFSLLRHTPLRVIGINTSMHFRVASTEKWHTAGHHVAPKEIWSGLLDNPGMVSLQMRESPRRDGKLGFLDVKVEPSVQVQPGLFLLVNDHYECSKKETMCADEVLAIVSGNWDESAARSEKIIYDLLDRITS